MAMDKLKKEINYYLGASYRRKELDRLQERYKNVYKGDVLDIGGRDRGNFKKPKNQARKWVFADIEEKHHPDIILDISRLDNIGDETYDVVSAMELFKHVAKPESGIKECYRVLRKGGNLILSAPFLYPVHADPYDFQRWTKEKWKNELKNEGFEIEIIKEVGSFFSVLCGMIKDLNKSFVIFKYLGYFLYPLLDIMVKLDNCNSILKNLGCDKYTTGYFIIAKK